MDANGHTVWSAEGSSEAPSTTASAVAVQDNGPQAYTGVLNRNDAVPQKTVAAMGFGQRVRIARLWQSHEELIGQTIRVAGWAKSTRAQSKELCFVELNDGSCFKNL